MNCIVCGNESPLLFVKGGYDYFQCHYCKTIFTPGGIDQKDMVGGEHEVGRNEIENALRIDRITSLVGKYGRILDYGCGHGMLVEDCKAFGLDAVGYDKFNPDFDNMPEGQFNIVSLIECVEHLAAPFEELDVIYDKLLPYGILFVETSFWDVAVDEDIPMDTFFYIAPKNGHSTIFSHFGLDVLMRQKGFKVVPAINRNVRIFQKK
jgi:SAM-dependent methyltransferase